MTMQNSWQLQMQKTSQVVSALLSDFSQTGSFSKMSRWAKLFLNHLFDWGYLVPLESQKLDSDDTLPSISGIWKTPLRKCRPSSSSPKPSRGWWRTAAVRRETGWWASFVQPTHQSCGSLFWLSAKVNQGLGTYALFGSVSRLVCGRNISSSPFTSGGTANRWRLSLILTTNTQPLFQVWQPARPDPGEGGRLDQVQVRQHDQPGVQRPHRVHGEFASNQVRLDLSEAELEGYIILFPSCFIVSLYLPFFWSIEFQNPSESLYFRIIVTSAVQNFWRPLESSCLQVSRVFETLLHPFLYTQQQML